MPFRILTLDGGGSKGVYTIGVLNELEKLLGANLHNHFNLIYGTSTGSIIASLLSLGKSCSEIKDLYFDLIPSIMSSRGAAVRSLKLRRNADEIFGDYKFEMFQTSVGIVSMNFDDSKPLIFKADVGQAYSMKSSFEPGFGCSISTAVQASCAAYPIFEKKIVQTNNQGTITAVDGGFIANNPTLFAITDVLSALNIPLEDLRVLSLGTGNFVEKEISLTTSLIKQLKFVQLFERTLEANSTATETLTKFLFPKLNIVRVNERFNQPQYGTNMVESNLSKLDTLFRLGRASFSNFEKDIQALFK